MFLHCINFTKCQTNLPIIHCTINYQYIYTYTHKYMHITNMLGVNRASFLICR